MIFVAEAELRWLDLTEMRLASNPDPGSTTGLVDAPDEPAVTGVSEPADRGPELQP